MARDDDDDDDRPRRRDRDRDDDRDQDRGRSRDRDRDDDRDAPAGKQMSVLGLLALIQGIGSAIVSIIPCVGALESLADWSACFWASLVGSRPARTRTSARGCRSPGPSWAAVAIIFGGIWLAVTAAFFKAGSDAVEESNARVTAARVKEVAEVKDGPAVTVTAATLQKDFDDNQLGADTKYKGKVLEVSGAVAKVGRTSSTRSPSS